MKHELKIQSLNDAQADCVCGWHYVFTGERTRAEVEAEYKKHLKQYDTLCPHCAKTPCIDTFGSKFIEQHKRFASEHKIY